MIGFLLECGLMFMFTYSVSTKMIKDKIAKEALEKEGKISFNENKNIIKLLKYYITEYAYTLVPIYNMKKTKKLFEENDINYKETLKRKLLNAKLIKKVEVKKEESKKQEKVEVKREESKKSKKVEVKNENTNTLDDVSKFISMINESDDIEFLKQVKREYKLKSSKLREKYNNNISVLSVKELNNIVRRVKIYDEVFIAAKTRLIVLESSNQIRLIK